MSQVGYQDLQLGKFRMVQVITDKEKRTKGHVGALSMAMDGSSSGILRKY